MAMSTTPMLAMPNFKLMFEVHTDASDIRIGAVLVQEGRPLAFLSKGSEKNQMVCLRKRDDGYGRSRASVAALSFGLEI